MSALVGFILWSLAAVGLGILLGAYAARATDPKLATEEDLTQVRRRICKAFHGSTCQDRRCW